MASLTTQLKQGLAYPYRYIKGRIAKAQSSADQLKLGEGAIVDIKGRKTAMYRDGEGKIIMLSPVCKHFGCIVGWNAAEKTWDCPCHGSRYSAEGRVINGPAKKDLDRLSS